MNGNDLPVISKDDLARATGPGDVVLALGVSAISVAGFLAFAGGHAGWLIFAATHLVATALPLCVLALERPALRRDPLLLALATFTMGPLGALGALVAALLARPFARAATPFHRWREMLFGFDEGEEHGAILSARPGAVSNLASFSDVLAFGTTPMKLNVVALIGREFRPVFAPVLQKALRDPVPAVRVQAAAVAASLEHDFHKLQSKAEADIQQHGANAERFTRLGNIHADFAASGLLEAERNRAHLTDAERAFRAAIELDPRHHEARRSLGILLAFHGNAGEAAALLQPLLAQGTRDPDTISAWCEAMLRLGDSERLRAAAAALSADGMAAADTALGQALSLWMPPPARKAQGVRA
ncbi:MAG TPA: hypothetical protein PL096_08355 [Micropepsaceae bacterium]|nr:hypothetical protein [Micropepsaceae bacterium]